MVTQIYIHYIYNMSGTRDAGSETRSPRAAETLLKNFMKGHNNIYVRKANKNGISKSQFLEESLRNPQLLADIKEWQSKNNNVTNVSPTSFKQNSELVNMIAKHANDKVVVKEPSNYARYKDNPPTMATGTPETRISTKAGDIFKKEAGGRTSQRGDPLNFLAPVIKHEVDRRVTGNYYAWNQPKKFSNWSSNPEEAAVQKEFVEKFEKAADDGKFVNYAPVKGSGMGVEKEVEMVDIISQEVMEQFAERAGLATARSRIGTMTEKDAARARASGIQGPIGDIVSSIRAPIPRRPPEQLIPDKPKTAIATSTSEGIFTDEPGPRPGTQTSTSTAIRVRERDAQPGSSITRVLERGPRVGEAQLTATDAPAPQYSPTQTVTEEGEKEGKKPKTKTATKQEPFPRIPVTTKTDTKPKEKEKRRPPIPRLPDDDTDDDTDDDDDKSKPKPTHTDPAMMKPDAFPELRPYFKVGGEDILKPSAERVEQEITDWSLYSFVPGYVYEGDDNPLTHKQRAQEYFRFHKTFPNPTVYKPRPYNGPGTNQLFRNQTQPYQPFFDANDKTQYRGTMMQFDQDRRNSSAIIDKGMRAYTSPDIQQRVYKDGRQPDSRVRKVDLMFASKSFF